MVSFLFTFSKQPNTFLQLVQLNLAQCNSTQVKLNSIRNYFIMMEQKYRSSGKEKQKRLNQVEYKKRPSQKWSKSKCKPQITKFNNSNKQVNIFYQPQNIQNIQNCSSQFKKICGDLKQVHLNLTRLNKLFASSQKQNVKCKNLNENENDNISQKKKIAKVKFNQRIKTQNTQNIGIQNKKVNKISKQNLGHISKSLFNINTIKLPPNFFIKKLNKTQSKTQKASIKTQETQTKIENTSSEISAINIRKRISSMQNLRKKLKIIQDPIQQKKQFEFTFYIKQKPCLINNMTHKPSQKSNRYQLMSDINTQNRISKEVKMSQNRKMIYKNLKYIHKLKQSLHQLKL